MRRSRSASLGHGTDKGAADIGDPGPSIHRRRGQPVSSGRTWQYARISPGAGIAGTM